MSQDFRVSPSSITEHFNPAWFAAVMGTAVLPLAISFVGIEGLRPISLGLIVLSALLFVIFLVPWTGKLLLFPKSVQKDLNHPIASNFFPTMPISLVLFALNLMKFPDAFFATETSFAIAWWLWLVGTTGIYGMGFVILVHIFRHQEIKIAHANFGWYIPPVSKLLIPVAGYELAAHFPQHAELAMTISTVAFGVGFFLFLFVGAAVYHRYIYHELPMSRFAATFFIGIAPTAIMAVILFKLMHLLSHHALLGMEPGAFSGLFKIAILFTWGFAAWWFLMALLVTLYYLTRIDLPYALSWWAFTFPTGALCVATGVTWKATGYGFVQYFYWFTFAFLVLIWLLVLIKTLRGVISGRIFAPTH
jgi:C4-dicarboxylate transporter/malic acid transport protein